MGYDAILRDALVLLNTETKSLQTPIQLSRWVRQTPTGDDVYEDEVPQTLDAIVEPNPSITYKKDGAVIPVRASILVLSPLAPHGAPDRIEPIDLRDKIVLADGTSGKILSVPGLIDPTTGRPYFSTILLGDA